MKVAVIAAPFVEIPPKGYGGTERILHYLSQEFKKEDLDVVFFASQDSNLTVNYHPIVKQALFNDKTYNHKTDREKRLKEINKKTIRLIKQDPKIELINLHDYDNPDLIKQLVLLDIPILITIGHATNPVIRDIYEQYHSHPNVFFQCLTHHQALDFEKPLSVIHHGINKDLYSVSNLPKKDFLMSIGDMKPIKGHKIAIALAKQAKLNVVIAGAPYYPEAEAYFEKEIKPHIDLDFSNNKEEFLKLLRKESSLPWKQKIIYFGTATDEEKKELYQNALFTQFLGRLEVEGNIEAFGMTMIESLLSGTPVIGVKGSVTEEVIEEGKEGFNVSSVHEAIEKLDDLKKLSPKTIRKEAEKKFSSRRMAKEYIALYKETKRIWNLKKE